MLGLIVAIDPGKKGAYAVSPRDGQPIKTTPSFPMDLDALSTLLRSVGSPHKPYPAIVVIEKLTGTGNGVPMALGENYGEILGMCRANNINPIMVPPQVWQRSRALPPMDYEDRKKALWKIALTLKPGIRKAEADALLILQWAYNLTPTDITRYSRFDDQPAI